MITIELFCVKGKCKFKEKIETPISLREIIVKLNHKLDGKLSNMIDWNNEKPRKNVVVLINGCNIVNYNGLDTVIRDEDKISFFPIIQGG